MVLEQVIGAAVMLLLLADVFLTVLYARAGIGLLAPRWNRAIWASLRAIAQVSGRHRAVALSFGGPLIVVMLIAFWATGLTVGAALLIQPELGTTIRPGSGDTPRDFVTALLVAGNSLSIVGSGDYAPHTTGTRILFLVNSLVGASVLSLVLSYLVQVYSALRERNALALTIDLMTAGSGDAAEMLARLMPNGDSSATVSELANLPHSLAGVKEAHHFYPLLFYFRFREPRYSVSRFAFVLLDLTTLIDTALDPKRYATLIGSTPVAALRRGASLLVETLDANFPTVGKGAGSASDIWKERQRYTAATDKLARARIAVRTDAIERYVAARQEWEPAIRRVGPALGYTMDDIEGRN